jgi:hypothetical protein
MEQHPKGPPGGTADLPRDTITEEGLLALYTHFSEGMSEIARRRKNVLDGLRPQWIDMTENYMRWDTREKGNNPEDVMNLTKYVNSPIRAVRNDAFAILQSPEWQHLNRIERNITPLLEDAGRRYDEKRRENRNNQQMATGEGRPMARGEGMPKKSTHHTPYPPPHMARGMEWEAGQNRRYY